jgi:DNA repair protein RadC
VIVHAAAGFVLVHNHHSGDPMPSPADVRLTKRVVKGARILGVGFLDHVIVGRRIGKPRASLCFGGGILARAANV